MVVCKADQIRNPKTGRCVKKTGKIGKEILAKRSSKSKSSSPRRISPRKISIKKKDCKPNQIRNPRTGRCVSKRGKIGKAVLAKRVRSRSKTRSPLRARSFILPVPRTAKARTHILKADRNVMNALGQMLFLSALHPNDCIPISTRNPRFLKDIGYVWKVEKDVRQLFRVNTEVSKHFERCLKDNKKRFILILLFLQYWVDGKNISNHANFLIYDKNLNEIERFEPHGSYIFLGKYKPETMDTYLTKFFKDSYGIRYFGPLDFCPIKGPQIIQELQSDIKKYTGETRDLCQYWAFWYANIRLENPDLERQDVIRRALLEMKKFPGKFTGYIINYASFFADVKPFLQDPQKLKQLVDKFTAD
jgi:hypothetical protein